MKTPAELKQVAIDLFDGKIFCDRQVNPDNIGMVFMPVMLGAFNDKTKEELEDIGLIYEYIEKAAPRSINGMPSFLSFCVLSKEETKQMFEFYNQYKELKEKFQEI